MGPLPDLSWHEVGALLLLCYCWVRVEVPVPTQLGTTNSSMPHCLYLASAASRGMSCGRKVISLSPGSHQNPDVSLDLSPMGSKRRASLLLGRDGSPVSSWVYADIAGLEASFLPSGAACSRLLLVLLSYKCQGWWMRAARGRCTSEG